MPATVKFPSMVVSPETCKLPLMVAPSVSNESFILTAVESPEEISFTMIGVEIVSAEESLLLI